MKKSSVVSSLLLAALLLAGCGESASAPAPSGGDNAAPITKAAEETVAETSIYDNLPTEDLGGYEFRVINNISNFATTVFDVAEQSGDVLEDAVYIRNRQVESRLNCVISVTDLDYDKVNSTIQKAVQSGEDVCDVYFNECHFQIGHSQSGYLYNLNDLPSVDTANPWWNTTAIESIRVGTPTYILFGDLHLMYSECYQPVFMNNGMIKSYGLDKPYTLVNDGTWTLDRMSEYMTVVTADVNGDGKMDADDQFGLGVWDHNVFAFLIGAGTVLVERDENNLPYWNGVTEDFVNKYTKVAETIFGDKNRIVNGNTSGVGSLGDTLHTMFHDGRCLFFVEPLGSLKKHRDAEFEVGVLPLPKLNEQQDGYKTYLFNGAAGLAVPVTSTHYKEVGLIVENLCAYSHEDLQAAYYDATLDFKYVNDEESVDMLDIIFENGRLDLAKVYAWAGYADAVGGKLAKGDPDITSTAAKYDTKLQTAIEKTLALYNEG